MRKNQRVHVVTDTTNEAHKAIQCLIGEIKVFAGTMMADVMMNQFKGPELRTEVKKSYYEFLERTEWLNYLNGAMQEVHLGNITWDAWIEKVATTSRWMKVNQPEEYEKMRRFLEFVVQKLVVLDL